MLDEYQDGQKSRILETGDREIHVSTLTSYCEQRALYEMRGIAPPEPTLEDVGARFHGTILHNAVEDIINRRIKGHIIEKEYRVKFHGWSIVAHPDLVARVGTRLYDLKFVNPYKFHMVRDVRMENPPSYTFQLNMYAYILHKNKLPVSEAYVDYISKSKQKLKSKGVPPLEIREFEIAEIPVELSKKYVNVMLRHAEDLIEKYERGEEGLDVKGTVEKLKRYMLEEGLDPSVLDRENPEKWMCDYCDYRDMCPLLQREKVKEEEEIEI